MHNHLLLRAISKIFINLKILPAFSRFIYVETNYFWSWYENLPQIDKDMVRLLVNEGRLEFISGGWCMSDEATPHYTAMIDQMTLGLQ